MSGGSGPMTASTKRSRSRTLTWSKEVERRARDLYRILWPEAARAKEHGVEDYAGHPDLVNVPYHVQVKARSRTAVGTMWEDADRVRKEKGTGIATHLVVQDTRRPPLVVMKLEDYIEERKGMCQKCGQETAGRQTVDPEPTAERST